MLVLKDTPSHISRLLWALFMYLQNVCQIFSRTSGFHPSTFVYSRFPPKIHFLYCLLSSVVLRGGPRVGIEEKTFGI